jgi:hypothetical protein
MLNLATKVLGSIISLWSKRILLDDSRIGMKMNVEHAGQYYGRSADDVTGVNEFNRLLEAGAAIMALI